jgi:hypothetical protein
MSDRAMQVLSIFSLVLASTLFVGVSPAYACHEATGWCCTSDGKFCCYFEDNEIIKSSCFETQH